MAENLKIDLSEFLINRVVGESRSLNISLVEKSWLLEIFTEDPYLNQKFPDIENVDKTIKIIDRNLFYDIYKFSYNNLSYIIKMGDENDFFIFQKEKNALESIKELNLSPLFLNTSSAENYSYFLTSFEHSDSSKDLGLSYTYENIELLGCTLAKIHNATKQEENEREYFIDSIYSIGSFEEIVDPDIYKSMLETEYFPICLKLLKSIKDAVDAQIFPAGESCSSLCHTNLNPSCILNRPGKMKICNFHNSFIIHPALDLAFASYKLQLDSHPFYEKKFLEAYHSESFLKEDYYSFTYFKQMSYKLMLYELVASYFFKMYVGNEEMGSVLSLFQNYALIRESVQDEFAEYMNTLDKMFAPFINNF